MEGAENFYEREVRTDSLIEKYNILVEHLDFGYIEKCKDGNELEKIVKILRSGEEGYFPELTETAERRLKEVKPKSKLLGKVTPVIDKSELSAEEIVEINEEFSDWLKIIRKNNKELDSRKINGITKGDYPKVRQEHSTIINENNNSPAEKRISSTDYASWDKFDADAEIVKMEVEEERFKKEALEKEKQSQTEKPKKSVSFNKFATEAEAFFEANREKEKGNEFYKSGDYKEAYDCYSKSISYKPCVSVYNNRAMASIKLKKFKQAVENCEKVFSIEANNIKARLRMALALEGLEKFKEAAENCEKVITVDPNNTTAQELAERLRKFCPQDLKIKKMSIQEV